MAASTRRLLSLAAAAAGFSGVGAVAVSVQTSLRRGSHHNARGAGAAAGVDNATDAVHRWSSWEQELVSDWREEVQHLSFLSFLFGEERRIKVAPRCGVSIQVTSVDDKDVRCPAECPVFVEHKGDGVSCDFRCVPATVAECQRMNPKEPIPDIELGACRACMVSGCLECATDGTDTCSKCSSGYIMVDGKCQSEFFWVWVAVFLAFGAILAVVLAWVVSLALSPTVNAKNLERGLAHRSRSMLLMPKGAIAGAPHAEGGDSPHTPHSAHHRRQPWSLFTNLCRTEVAGPGLNLQFNFQAALIVWAVCIGLAWYVLVLTVDPELGELGTHRGGTPRQNCIVVAFGWQAQRRLMPIKIKFVTCVYVISFVMAMVFAVLQARRFAASDAEQTTHKDFCARCTGVPEVTGEVELERELKETVSSVLSKKVVNVSVCWDYEDQESELIQVLENDLAVREEERRRHRASGGDITDETSEAQVPMRSDDSEAEPEQRSCWAFRKVEQLVFSDGQQDLLDNMGSAGCATDREFHETREKLLSMQCTGQAFVVFESELDRDAAVELCQTAGGIAFRDSMLKLEAADCEPATMLWQNCVEKTLMWKVKRSLGGFVTYMLALSFWVFAFYAPYAYIILSANYAYGQEPGLVTNLSFTMVVVVGNALMYFTCSEISDRLGFESADNREVLYMLLYTVACMMNVLLDMVVTYFMAYQMLVGVGMTTWQGKPLAEVHSFTERFETYAMQRSLGDNLWQYSFPSTFLVPFLIEPVGTIYLPYKVMSWIVGSNKGIHEWTAARLLTPAPMDLSRYADVLLNVMLAALVFYFPPGWTHYMFFALAMSHCVIYLLDHFKVLRCIPSCYFSSADVDWWAQWMLSIPCAIMLASLIFKMNSLSILGWRLHGPMLVAACTGAALLHIIVHTLALYHVVPRFTKTANKSSADSKVRYRTCAKALPVSWFGSNPIYCLRSKYIYKQDPPCDYVIAGKEHLLRVNEAEGYYFHDHEALVEAFADVEVFNILRKSVVDGSGKVFSDIRKMLSSQDVSKKDDAASSSASSSSQDTPVHSPRQAPAPAPPSATVPAAAAAPASAPPAQEPSAATAPAAAAAPPSFSGQGP